MKPNLSLYTADMDLTFAIRDSVQCCRLSDDCVWCFIAAVCDLPPCRDSEVMRHFHVISH